MIMLGEILPYCKPGSKDFRRLGRWDSSILTAKQNHYTRVVHAYGVLPCSRIELRGLLPSSIHATYWKISHQETFFGRVANI